MTLMLALALALSQPAPTETTEVTRQLTRIEQQLAATWKHGDCSSWGAMVAPEWSVIHITGTVIAKVP